MSDKPDFRRMLTPAQACIWDDPDPVKTLLTSRRFGKTTFFAPWLLDAAWDSPEGVLNPYIGLTKQAAKLQFWPVLIQAAKDFDLQFTTNETQAIFSIKGRGSVFVGGCADKREAERWRGYRFLRAAPDECGGHNQELLEILVEDSIEPTLMDFNGEICCGGTPGRVLRGIWYRKSGPKARGYVHHYTWRDNPHLQNAEAFIRRKMEEKGWTATTPKYLREYEGQWVVDASVLVFPPPLVQDSLPTSSGWKHAIGIDATGVKTIGIVVSAAHPHMQGTHVIHAEERDAGVQEVDDVIAEFRDRYPGARVQERNPISYRLELAEAKISHPHLTDELRRTRIRYVRTQLKRERLGLVGEAGAKLAEVWERVTWDDEETPSMPDPRYHDPVSEAAVCSIAALAGVGASEPKPSRRPKIGSSEWARAQEARIIAELESRMEESAW